MKYTYTEFLDILDWELQQEKQGGDSASADKYRFLPHTQALRVVNETIKELVVISPDQFEREYTYTVVIPDELNNAKTKHIKLPGFIFKVISYWDTEEESWRILGDSSDLDSDIVSIDSNTIYKEDGWSDGETVKLKVVAFPYEVEATNGTSLGDVDTYSNNVLVMDYGENPEIEAGQQIKLSFAGQDDFYIVDQVGKKVVWSLYLNKDCKFNFSPGTSLTRYSSIIPMPSNYIRLLVLEIKRKAYSRKGKALSQFEYSELMRLKAQWSEETSPVQQKSRIAFEGYGLGR